MKCINCEINIPPTYSKAILENLCPACGKEILSANDFRELMRVRGLLQDLELDSGLVVTAAAAISQKYDLVPKGSREKARQTRLPTEKEIDGLEGLNEEERLRLKALAAAQADQRARQDEAIIKEWGMDHGQLGAGPDGESIDVDPDMAALFNNMVVLDPEVGPPLHASKTSNHERLARAEALQSDSSRFRVMRAE